MNDDGSGVLTKQTVRNIYNEKYQKTYSNWYYVLKITLLKIQEYVRHAKEENEGQQFLCI